MKTILQKYNLILAIIVCFGATISSFGQTDIAAYSGESSPQSTSVANSTSDELSRGAGIGIATGASFNSNGFTETSLANAISANDYVEWSLSANSGYILNISSFEIDYDKSPQGPADISIRTSLDNYGSDIYTDSGFSDSGVETTVDLSSSPLISSDGGTITFRLYAWNASASNGTFDIEDDLGTVLMQPNTGIRLIGNVDEAGAPAADYVYVDDTTGWVPNDPSDAGNPSSASNSVLVQAGTATTAGDFSADTVTIDSGATLNAQGITVVTSITNSGSVTISGVLVAPSATIITGDDFTFKNTSMSTGIIGLTTAATFTGNVTVERFIPQSNRAYRLLASPLKNTGTINTNWQEAQPETDNGFGIHITGTGGASNGFDATSLNNPSMYIVNEQADPAAYVAVTSTTMGDGSAEEDGVLKHGIGYLTLVRGNRSTDLTNNDATASEVTLRTTGDVHTGDYVVTASNLNPDPNGAILVGNPYQAPVDMKAVLDNPGTTDIQTDAYHVYDPTLGDNGAFVTVTFGNIIANDVNSLSFPLTDTDPENGVIASNSGADRFLQPGQSAFVNTDTPLVGSPTPAMTFTEVNKVTDEVNTDIFFTSNTTSDKFISIALYDLEAFTNNETPRDGSLIRFNDNYNSSFDNLDASKAGNLDENLGTLSEGNLLSIDSRALPVEGDEISLSISNYKKTDYTLQLRLSDFENTSAYLVDSYLGTQTLLTNSGETLIQFSVDDSEPQSLSDDRFEIIFTQNVLGVDTFNESLLTVFPNPVSNGQLTLNLVNGNLRDANIEIYNMLGQKVLSENVSTSTQQTTINTSKLNSGVYIVNATIAGNTISKRIIIK
ncbi:T9SS type A sorting domain-containing protein [Croceibacter atlanticus]|uniref:T9SS type A sorting domain-containing protein n=1 Tax=Croceibacter atlanticus TaxID=313588 RepID=UPI0030DD473E|tara:strand:+ start:16219 stop:18732 length:2514 start_codon:yes stop_codon:yes gene_type:complete